MMKNIVQRPSQSRSILACSPDDAKRSAVYRIVNKVNGKVYIGFTRCISDRCSQHYSDLMKGKHGNTALQRDWIDHGSENFKMEIVQFYEGENGYALEIPEIKRVWKEKGRENVYNTHCYESMKHGMTGTPTWEYWRKKRHDKENGWPKRWDDLTLFVEDLGLKPGGNSKVSKKDEALPHGKGNSFWCDDINRAFRVSLFTIDGETKSVSDWARAKGVEINTVHGRLRRGRSIEKALSPENNRQKITDQDALEIRIKHSNGISRNDLCDEYGLAKNTVRAILLGETFKCVGGPIIKKKWTKT